MRVERTLWWVAIACAFLLLFAPMTGRTWWGFDRGGAMTHSAGWDWVAPVMGIVAFVNLLIGQWLRPGVIRPSICAVITVFCFGVAAVVALGHWLDLRSGTLDIGGATTHPAPGVGYFGGIGVVGMVASVALLGIWLRKPSPPAPLPLR
jgi:hypothetical protein